MGADARYLGRQDPRHPPSGFTFTEAMSTTVAPGRRCGAIARRIAGNLPSSTSAVRWPRRPNPTSATSGLTRGSTRVRSFGAQLLPQLLDELALLVRERLRHALIDRDRMKADRAALARWAW